MPRYFLMEEGIDPKTDFDGQPNFSGSHDTTYKLVESGSFQAGALNKSVWEAAVADKKVDTSKVKVFYTTPGYYDYNWTINKVDEKFGKGTKQKITGRILSINIKQPEIMELFQTEKFIETNNENYKRLKKLQKKLGLLSRR